MHRVSRWPKVRYDLEVDGTKANALREGEVAHESITTTEKYYAKRVKDSEGVG